MVRMTLVDERRKANDFQGGKRAKTLAEYFDQGAEKVEESASDVVNQIFSKEVTEEEVNKFMKKQVESEI